MGGGKRRKASIEEEGDSEAVPIIPQVDEENAAPAIQGKEPNRLYSMGCMYLGSFKQTRYKTRQCF